MVAALSLPLARDRFVAADVYSDLGWSIIPVDPNTKKPVIPSWMEFTERRATCGERDRWARRFPRAGIAVLGGEISNLLILDIDGEAGVREARKLGLPTTPMVKTPRGGLHCYFTRPDIPSHRSSTKLGESRSLDVRGDGAYVVAPYSQRTDGRRYEWVHSPLETKLAAPPKWFVEMLMKVPREPESSVRLKTIRDDDHSFDRLDPATRAMVEEGHDLSKFPSRSECDLFVVGRLIAAGFDEESIFHVFDTQPIGEKYQEAGERYLNRTIQQALQHFEVVRVKYADINRYEGGGCRFQLCLMTDSGILRTGVTVPRSKNDETFERWKHFVRAFKCRLPTNNEELSRFAKKIVGRRVRIEVNRGRQNPVVAFYRL